MANIVEFFKPGDAVTWGVAPGTNAVQTATITGAPAGGDFTLTFNGYTTGPIAFDATAADVEDALEALPTVGVGNVDVTGGPGPGTPYVITFVGQLAGAPQGAVTAAEAFTGGTDPAITVAATTTVGIRSQVFGGQFVEAVGDDTCAHPTATGSTKVVGLAITDGLGASPNQSLLKTTVVDDGVWPVLAGAAIAAGDRVEAGANGVCIPLASGVPVGRAQAGAAAGTYAKINVNVT